MAKYLRKKKKLKPNYLKIGDTIYYIKNPENNERIIEEIFIENYIIRLYLKDCIPKVPISNYSRTLNGSPLTNKDFDIKYPIKKV